MKKPFGFVQAYYVQEDVMKLGLSSDPAVRFEMMTAKAGQAELKFKENFDAVTINIAAKMGMEEIPWLKLTYRLAQIYAVLTILVLFHRPDFINLTVVTVAFYMLFNL